MCVRREVILNSYFRYSLDGLSNDYVYHHLIFLQLMFNFSRKALARIRNQANKYHTFTLQSILKTLNRAKFSTRITNQDGSTSTARM
jgi:hypothetical protein